MKARVFHHSCSHANPKENWPKSQIICSDHVFTTLPLPSIAQDLKPVITFTSIIFTFALDL